MEYYLLIGAGKSNLAVAKDLKERQIPFDVYIDKDSIPQILKEWDTKICRSPDELKNKYSFVIKSPGVSFEHPAIKKCEEMGVPITNEIGYSIRFVETPVIGITGTNGKTTTTSLVEHILNSEHQRARAVGNIGNSFLEEAKKQVKILVTELSSFQLRDLKNFNPDVSVWLNVNKAHLDYHKTFNDYLVSKKNIFKNQSPDNIFIYNEDDNNILKVAEEKRGEKRSFSLKNNNANAYFDGEYIRIDNEKWIHKNKLGIKGLHNIQNAMAGILALQPYVNKEKIITGLQTFAGVEHRLEKVIENNKIKVYNDSKSTNTTAVKAALSAFEEPVVLMMGGLDRGNGYEDLRKEWAKVKTVICFGQSGEKIYQEAKQYTEAILEENIKQAIELAKKKVASGGILLFSPGCASWDAFTCFEERGKFFKEKILFG